MHTGLPDMLTALTGLTYCHFHSFQLWSFACKSLIRDLIRIQFIYIPPHPQKKKKYTNILCHIGLQHHLLVHMVKANLEHNRIK